MANNANKSTIHFRLSEVSTAIVPGTKPVYRATVITNGSVNKQTVAQAIAERTGEDESFCLYFLEALNNVVKDKMMDGYCVNLGQLKTNFAIVGPFGSANESFDPARNTLIPTVHACNPLKSVLAGITPVNITKGLTCTVGSLMDNVTKETNIITGSNEVHIQGIALGIDTDNADEGVTLVDEAGLVKATATIIASDAQTIDCRFATPPVAGVYTLVVACRNGERVSLAPAIGKLKDVVVKTAA